MISVKGRPQQQGSGTRSHIAFLLLLAVAGILAIRCDFEKPTSIWELPDDESAADGPAITGILPADSSIAGVGEIRIEGIRFSTELEQNLVFFDDTRAEIVSFSDTEIIVKSPRVAGDAVKVRVSRGGAFMFSNVVEYRMIPSVVTLGTLLAAEAPAGIAVDAGGNVSVSLATGIVRRFTPAGSADYDAPFLSALGMKIGPDDHAYALWNLRRRAQVNIFSSEGTYVIPVDTTVTITCDTITSICDTTTTVNYTDWRFAGLGKEGFDLDFDADTNLWVANATELTRIKPDGSSSTEGTYTDTMTSVRVYDDYVYFIETSSLGGQKLARSPLHSGGTLGSREEVYDFSAIEELAGVTIYSFTFSSAGDLYLATDDSVSAIFVNYADTGNFEHFYPGLIDPPILYLGWGIGSFLYASRAKLGAPQILKIDVRRERVPQYSAPYHGREF
ncbi:MAG: IPT/TIG domain-containing protein [Fidelibacterota bacterium]|nr:MAG: IPT/TIG domain-containing protein [Candidatus Neomarinimicrobiota bacterium]